MALIQNDIGPISARRTIEVVLIGLLVLGAGFVLYKQFRRTFFPAPVDANQCKDDPNYHYKDPSKHPQDCK